MKSAELALLGVTESLHGGENTMQAKINRPVQLEAETQQ
jgi:hypothetical protein